jgi:phosphoribosylglycinamide formyltransferase-1
MEKLKLGVLGSGKGSNYLAIQEAIDAGALAAETRIVISDVETAGILEIARSRGVPALHLPPGKFRTRLEPEAEQRYVEALRRAEVELVVLAGFMRVIKQPLLDAFAGRIINIHPSLLPAHPGLEAWKQALLGGTVVTGCTVHRVDHGVDSGEIIAQRKVPVLPGDTPETLHARIQIAEHELYPAVIAQLAAAKLKADARKAEGPRESWSP